MALKEPAVIECSIEKAWNILGNKWAFFVLRELYEGTRRFSELQRAMHGISPKSLTDTLRHLERHGVVYREVFPTVPVTVQYSVTHKGEAFHVVIKEMKRWGAQWG
ncbi:transcriptional regulator [Alicyclobacillaceae bacterium I2511]|nr:transcriptional regulator [Alicyclobacillaceae bacterium I2511]